MDKNMITDKQHDVFSDAIRQKLEHYELPVDNRIWQEIEQKLPQQPVAAFPWKTMIAIVALVGVVGAFLFFNQKTGTLIEDGKMEEIIAGQQTKDIPEQSGNENNPYVIEKEVVERKNINVGKNISQNEILANEYHSEDTITTKEENLLAENDIEQVVEIQDTINQSTTEEKNLIAEKIETENHNLPKKTTENNNLSSQNYEEIIVITEPEIVPDKFFSPNADGINDEWKIEGIDAYTNYVLEIYNRSGNLLFRSEGDFKGWDGKYKGRLMPSTDYWYVLKINELNKIETGSFTLRK